MKHRLQRQKPQLSAAEINRWNRAALQLQYDRYRDPPTRFELPNNQVWVRNDTFYDMAPYSVAHLDGLVCDYDLDYSASFSGNLNSSFPTPLDYVYKLKNISTASSTTFYFRLLLCKTISRAEIMAPPSFMAEPSC
jgi:hypothetical protein